jgi:hypothetical protein
MKRLLAISLLLLAFFGCAGSIGDLSNLLDSSSHLDSKNFSIVQSGIEGSAHCWYLLPGIPLGEMALYKAAMADLRKKVDQENRSTALVNVTVDNSTLGLLLCWKKQITITADVIEFVSEQP